MNQSAAAPHATDDNLSQKRTGVRKHSEPNSSYSNRNNNNDKHENSTKQVRNNFFDINNNILIMSQ